jgi:hypothetical protein
MWEGIITGIISLLIAVGGGLWALWKYMDQRQRELREQRFEQYWKLIETCLDSPKVHKQLIALRLLQRYPEFRDETLAFLSDAKRRSDDWAKQNISTIDHVLNHFGHGG